MKFRILGPVQALHEGSPLPVGGPRHRRLLAVLLLHTGEHVPTGRLIDALWGDAPPRSAPAMVHVRMSELRAALRPGQPELLTRDGGYLLRVDPDDLDARQFERLAAAGVRALAAGDPARARADLSAALELWHGPALAEFAAEPFARSGLARLSELRLQTVEHRIAADLALGRHGELVPELEKVVAEHPLRERLWGQLMVALYRAGRQGEALSAYQTLRQLMADQLGIDPGRELRQLHAAILRQDPELDPPVAAASPPAGTTAAATPPAGNLPAPLTSFVGRRRELLEVRTLLREARLVTLTGVGGVGKSRLAAEAAARCRPHFRDGVWLVELATLAQPGFVASAVATAVGVWEHPRRPLLDSLTDHLAGAEALLLLDNCEHLVDEVADVADRLLRSCPKLRILATSRERLRITGETVRPVAGLGVPDPAATATAAIGRAEAVRLLVERASAVQPGFALTGATAAPVAETCRRLDGLPLALELAAAAVPAWGVEQVVARLDEPFRLLVRGSRAALPRHQTLSAAVDWSYSLLAAGQQRLFDQLAVFVGGFTVAAAEAVCGGGPTGDPPVADLLAGLVDKSLITVDHAGDGPPRYRMLQTLRAYGWERLDGSGAAAGVRDRHAAYLLAMVAAARRALRGLQQPVVLRRLATELGNIRAALEWTIRQADAETAVRLAGSLYPLWDQHGHYREGRQWLERALQLDAPVRPLVRARALDAAAGLAVIQGDLVAATAAATEAATLSRAVGDRGGVARALTTCGLAAIYAGEPDRAVTVLEEALRNAEGADDRWPEAFALIYLIFAAWTRGDHPRAARLVEAGAMVVRELGDPEAMSGVALLRGLVAWQAGDRAAAADALREGLQGFGSLGHRWGLSLALVLAAGLAGTAGDHERAVSLLGTSEAVRESLGAAPLPFVQALADGVADRAGRSLAAAALDRAWRTGRSKPVERALTEALRDL